MEWLTIPGIYLVVVFFGIGVAIKTKLTTTKFFTLLSSKGA